MNHTIRTEEKTIPIEGGKSSMGAWLAYPTASGRYSAVIVGMEIFGITDHIKAVTTQLAKLGYVAIALDFYHRTEAGVCLPYTQEGRTKGLELMHKLNRTEVIQDVKDAVTFLHTRHDTTEKIGFLGFSLGGHIGYLIATQVAIQALACFYAGWLTNTDIALSRPEPTVTLTKGMAEHSGRIIYFVGDQDNLITADQLKIMENALNESAINHEVIVYPKTKHGFFCNERLETFNEAARDDAWKRIHKLFEEELS